MAVARKVTWPSVLLIAAACAFIVALGFRVAAEASDGRGVPEEQTPVGLSQDNVHAGNDIRVWNASNDEFVELIRSQIGEIEEKIENNPDEGYEVELDRAKQDLEALCSLPETTAC